MPKLEILKNLKELLRVYFLSVLESYRVESPANRAPLQVGYTRRPKFHVR